MTMLWKMVLVLLPLLMLVTCAVGDDGDLWWCHRGLGRMSPTPLPRVVPMKRRTQSVSVLPPRSELQSGPPKKRAPRGMCTLENFKAAARSVEEEEEQESPLERLLRLQKELQEPTCGSFYFFLLTWSYGTYALLRRGFLCFLFVAISGFAL